MTPSGGLQQQNEAARTLPPVYPILDVGVARRQGRDLAALAAAFAGLGLTLQQLRAKQTGSGEFIELADLLAATLHHAGARLLINDRADLALACGADGVHLGQDDLPPAAARSLLPAGAVVGFSTHSVEQVEAAIPLALDYLAIGPIFSTSTKDNPDPVVGLEGLRRVRAVYRGPLVAIGGITLANCREVWEAGADSVALISALLAAPDPVDAARNFLLAFQAVSRQSNTPTGDSHAGL